MNDRIPYLREKSLALTHESGVYLMRNKSKTIIYVGKAKNLKNRVSSYFRSLDKHTPKVYAMVMQVYDFDIMVTESEFEALVLECHLIKLHMPRYNILLKDDKGYSYLKMEIGEFPKIYPVRKKEEDGCKYFGPFMSYSVVAEMADSVNKTLGLPTCHRKFPDDFRKERPCLNYQIKQCMGVCRGNISEEEYAGYIKRAEEMLSGKTENARKTLEKDMYEASDNLEFEKAARLRDRIKAIDKFFMKQRVVFAGAKNQDVIAFIEVDRKVSAAVMKFRDETLVDKREFFWNDSGSMAEIRDEFLKSYYIMGGEEIPPLIVIDEEIEDKELLERLLTEKSGRKVSLLVPQRGDNVRLLENAKLNASQRLSAGQGRTDREVTLLNDIKTLLKLPKTPNYIEAYDISNIGSDTIVGGMVVFSATKPLKANYKKFSIKDLNQPDDYTSMKEVLKRRFFHYLDENEEDRGFKTLPDLLLIDGGKGHLHAAQEVLDSLGLNIPTFGMVKDSKHRTRAIESLEGEIAISPVKNVFSFITAVQDEVHRYTIGFARKSHTKTAFQSELTNVPYIGEKRAANLFLYFRTKKAIFEASQEELEKVPGMDKRAAESLFEAVRTGKIS